MAFDKKAYAKAYFASPAGKAAQARNKARRVAGLPARVPQTAEQLRVKATVRHRRNLVENPTYKENQMALNRQAYHENAEEHQAGRWAREIWKDFGMTPDDYQMLLQSQGGVCALCRQPETKKSLKGKLYRYSFDHDHKLKKGDKGFIRGLLCAGCNRGIGQLKDSAVVCRLAAEYLEKPRG